MTSSSTVPAAPNTQNVAVGLLVAESISKSNETSQKRLQSQKEIGEQFMEQDIASAIQQIMDNAPDHDTALADIKKFLSTMSATDQSWGSDIQSWITGELNTANSYTTSQALLDALNADQQNLQKDEQALQKDQGALDACNAAKDTLLAKLKELNNDLSNCQWYDWLDGKGEGIAIAVAGVAIALAAVYVGVGITQVGVNNDQTSIQTDDSQIAKDKQNIQNDPALVNNLNLLASGNNLMQSEANQNVTGYKATVNGVEALNKAIDAIIQELAANGKA